MVEILYEDKHIIICVKPVGMLSQKDQNSNDVDMVTYLSEYRVKKNEPDYIGIVHRLDRNVGGLMVFAKSKQAAGKLSTAINERSFTKEYLTVVKGCPETEHGNYTDLLFKDSSKNKSYVVSRMRKGVKEASLDYRVIETIPVEQDLYSLVLVHLNTGRTHQIRVQFSSRKMPLLGDGKYGSKSNQCEIALWSYRLAFAHPMTKKEINISKEPTDSFPWNVFHSVVSI